MLVYKIHKSIFKIGPNDSNYKFLKNNKCNISIKN